MFELAMIGSGEAALQCYDCHGSRSTQDVRPTDEATRNPDTGGFPGNHQTHMPAGTTIVACSTCHPGSSGYTSRHRDGKIKISSKINRSPQTTTYHNNTSAWPQTHTPQLSSCNNVNCHFEQVTPSWGSPALEKIAGNCGICHGSPPTDGHHPGNVLNGRDKHGEYLGTDLNSCAACHTDHRTEFGHATSVGKRPLNVQFTRFPFTGAAYTGNLSYPAFLPSQSPTRDGACSNYCHSNASGGAPKVALTWSDSRQSQCFSCHGGRTVDNTAENCAAVGGTMKNYSSADGSGQMVAVCTPYLNMTSNGHKRLVGPRWIRKYACSNCHSATVQAFRNTTTGKLYDGDLIRANHVNGEKNVKVPDFWAIPGKPLPSYSPFSTATTRAKTCYNVYCHSDGTNDAKSEVKPYAWTDGKTKCSSCHGHSNDKCVSCHYDHVDENGKAWTYINDWPAGQQWKAAIPIFANEGPGTPRANSHPKHTQNDFTCNRCHADTVKNGTCTDCHNDLSKIGGMTEVAHINPDKHVNGIKDVKLLAPTATYNNDKTCSSTGTGCHGGMADPQWGGASSGISSACMDCHGNANSPDTDNYIYNGGTGQAKINLQEWYSSGHGRPASRGAYKSGNPAANFTANACWYCHDSSVMHNMSSVNPFRLRQHQQFKSRFNKECAYCHMEGVDIECLRCHNDSTGESLAPQLSTIYANESTARWPDGTLVSRPAHGGLTSCMSINCHYVDRVNTPKNDIRIHNEGAGFWTAEQNADVKNQYVQMGVCLQCHDDDSNERCAQCHGQRDASGNFVRDTGNKIIVPVKYQLGFSVGGVVIKPVKARATSAHFGYKHYKNFIDGGGWDKDLNGNIKGTWKGGKFCWDCHDPHGDRNLYMIHDKVATSTDGKFGIPKSRSDVVFVKKEIGTDYITRNTDGPPYVGICNVCHSSNSKHYRKDGSDTHNQSRICTSCHEHRFSDSHAGNNPCNSCHKNKPVPRHSAFGLPRDCTKCHAGTILGRMDVMTQLGANSHHIQGVAVSNRHCYACHWESTKDGIIDLKYHAGFNYKNYSTVSNDAVDLVLYGAGKRPTFYSSTSAVRFLAKNIGTTGERAEAGKVTNHCLSCHSDQNNETMPFNDCKTPRQYAWDGQSVAARYTQTGTTTWGKYNSTTYPNANKKDTITKAFSAHGNAKANQGGWDDTTGLNGTIPNTRDGNRNVQCYDCHSSHGSKVVGTTTSYTTFNGTRNGGNLKETQAGKGGYSMTYKASQNAIPNSVNPYAAGAGQCFDCHMNQNAGSHSPDPATPWGFGTFSASKPIKGYRDAYKFGSRNDQSGFAADTFKLSASPMKKQRLSIKGSHFRGSPVAEYGAIQTPNEQINGLCTPCHDPHGVSPTLGSKQVYAVPLLKGTWMTSPYKEDEPAPNPVKRWVDRGSYYGGWQFVGPTDKSWGSYGYEAGKPKNGPLPGEPVTKIYLDRNTFGIGKTISEDDQTFAGLCLRCHNKEKLSDSTPTQQNYQNQNFRTVDRIHETVKGWGKNKEHAFSCSKCHQPHNSTLPRLMQTNCLDYQHRGNRENGGQAWTADKQGQFNSSDRKPHSWGDEHRGYPEGDLMGRYSEASTACHTSAPGNSGTWPDNQFWNNKTPWSTY